MEEVKQLNEEEIKHQQDVEKTKQAILETIRLRDPKMYYKLTHKEGYKPWNRQEYFNADIKSTQEMNEMYKEKFGEEGKLTPSFKRKIGRNDLCTCGSGKKVKHCCGTKTYYTIPKAV